jgi:hypothetical protein
MTDGQITNRDLFEAQRGTEKQLGALALQVATLVAEWRGVGDRLDSGSARMADFEARMRMLEQFRWRIAGAATAAGFTSGAIGALVSWIVTRH